MLLFVFCTFSFIAQEKVSGEIEPAFFTRC